MDYIKSLPTHVVVIGIIVIYVIIGVIVSYIAGCLDDGNNELMALGILWPFVIPLIAVLGVLWIFCLPFKVGQKHHRARNLTDEETEIYESWLDSEAKDTGVNIIDSEEVK